MPLIFVAALLTPAAAIACSIVNEPSPKEIYDKTSNIFHALVTRTELIELDFYPEMEVQLVRVHFRVLENFKGSASDEDYVLTHTGYFGGCALPVLPGLQYVFAPHGMGGFFDFSSMELSTEVADIVEKSLGVVTILQSDQMPGYEPRLKEALAEIRQWITEAKQAD